MKRICLLILSAILLSHANLFLQALNGNYTTINAAVNAYLPME